MHEAGNEPEGTRSRWLSWGALCLASTVAVVACSSPADDSDGEDAAATSIGVSWEILNSVMSHNEAVGHGANPGKAGTPGGGSGGAIYTDGYPGVFFLGARDPSVSGSTIT